MPKFINQPYIPDYDMQISYDSDGRQEFIGIASPKSLISAKVWQIYKLAYDGSGRMITRRYTNNALFTAAWDNRTNLDYTDI